MIHRFVLRDRAKAAECVSSQLFDVLRSFVTTEKSTKLMENGEYMMRVGLAYNKFEIRRAVEEIFKVKVVRVRTARLPGKCKRFKGKLGQRPSVKRAFFKLAEGQVLEGIESWQ